MKQKKVKKNNDAMYYTFLTALGLVEDVCGFFPCLHLGRMTIYSPPVFFFLHSLCQDRSTVAQRAETTVAKCPLTSCVWARFLIDSPHWAWTAE